MLYWLCRHWTILATMNKSTLSWCVNLLTYCWIRFANILLRILTSMILSPSFLFHLFLLCCLWFISFLYLVFVVVVLFLVALSVRLGCLFVSLIPWSRLLLLWVVFSLSFVSRYFLLPLWFLQWSLGYSEAYCLASMCLCFYSFLFFFPVVDI